MVYYFVAILQLHVPPYQRRLLGWSVIIFQFVNNRYFQRNNNKYKNVSSEARRYRNEYDYYIKIPNCKTTTKERCPDLKGGLATLPGDFVS